MPLINWRQVATPAGSRLAACAGAGAAAELSTLPSSWAGKSAWQNRGACRPPMGQVQGTGSVTKQQWLQGLLATAARPTRAGNPAFASHRRPGLQLKLSLALVCQASRERAAGQVGRDMHPGGI